MYKVYRTLKGYVAVCDDEIKVDDWVYSSWSLPERNVFQVVEILEKSYIDTQGFEHPFYHNIFVTKKIFASSFKLFGLPLFDNPVPVIDGLSILKSIGYDNNSITSTEKWIAEELNKKFNFANVDNINVTDIEFDSINEAIRNEGEDVNGDNAFRYELKLIVDKSKEYPTGKLRVKNYQ
jgi:hypothetical protein